MIRFETQAEVEAYFWARVDKSAGPDGCWPWTQTVDADGYGAMRFWRRKWRTHRLALTLSDGPIASGLVVRHSCDNPPCCNPAHLTTGSVADNNADMLARGRYRLRKGTLTPSQVAELRHRYVRGEGSPTLGRAFGICQTSAHRVATGRTFRNLPMPTLGDLR